MVGYVKAWQSWWGGVMRGDVRFGRVRFVWAWGGSLGELRFGLAWLGEVRQGGVRFGS